MSTATIKDRFEAAYQQRVEQLAQRPKAPPQPKNKAEYGKAYYADKLKTMN
jgi:hypothetical protein